MLFLERRIYFDKGLDIKKYELVEESKYDFKFRNKESNKIISIRY